MTASVPEGSGGEVFLTVLRHPVVRYALVASPVCILIFLWLAGFFAAWEGAAVGRRPAAGDDASAVSVVIVTDDGQVTEAPFPTPLAQRLELPVFRMDLVGTTPPKDAPRTSKSMFSLHFLVTPPGGHAEVQPSATPSAVLWPALLFLLGFLVHNVVISGLPWQWVPRTPEEIAATNPEPSPESAHPEGGGAHGPPPPVPASRSHYGPPPKKRRR